MRGVASHATLEVMDAPVDVVVRCQAEVTGGALQASGVRLMALQVGQLG